MLRGHCLIQPLHRLQGSRKVPCFKVIQFGSLLGLLRWHTLSPVFLQHMLQLLAKLHALVPISRLLLGLFRRGVLVLNHLEIIMFAIYYSIVSSLAQELFEHGILLFEDSNVLEVLLVEAALQLSY